MTIRLSLVLLATIGAGTAAHAQARLERSGGSAPVHGRLGPGGDLQASQPDGPLARQYVDTAGGVSIEAAVARALANEPSLRAARTEVDVAAGLRVQAGLRPNPVVLFSQQNEPAGTDRQTRVEVQWPLDLFRRGARVTVADRGLDAARQAAADRERVLAAEVRSAYGSAAAAVRDVTITDELGSALSRQLALVEGRVAQGATPQVERDILQVELRRLEADRVLQAGAAAQAMLALKRLLGLEPDAPLRIRTTLEELVQADAEPLQIAPAGARARPDVLEARARVAEAEARVDLARREGGVDVSLFGMYMRMDAGFPQRGFTPGGGLERVRGLFHNVGGGAMVTVPLLDRNQGGVLAAGARRAGAAARLEAAELSARAEIASAVARDEHARRAAALYSSEARALARQTLDVVGQTYELGRATVFDVLAEQRRFLDVERGYTSVMREMYDARQALRLALGEVR